MSSSAHAFKPAIFAGDFRGRYHGRVSDHIASVSLLSDFDCAMNPIHTGDLSDWTQLHFHQSNPVDAASSWLFGPIEHPLALEVQVTALQSATFVFCIGKRSFATTRAGMDYMKIWKNCNITHLLPATQLGGFFKTPFNEESSAIVAVLLSIPFLPLAVLVSQWHWVT